MRGRRALLPLLLALLAMAPGLRGGFVLDDGHAILEHPAVVGQAPLAEAFTRDYWGGRLGERTPSWRPLATLSFRLDATLFGLRALPFHLTSLALYLLAVFLVHRLGRRLVSERAALIGSALFAVLPIHVEAVASLVGRADLLSLIGALTALEVLAPFWSDAEGEPGALRLLCGCGLFFCALLAKESAILLPLLVVALAWPALRGRTIVAAFSLALVAALYVLLRLWVLPETFAANKAIDDPIVGTDAATHALHALQLLGAYGYITALPVDLCTGRKYSQIARPDLASAPLWCAGIVLLLVVVGLTRRDRRRAQAPLALCATIAWLIFSGLLFALPEAMADRFALQPSVFFALLLGRGADAWLSRTTVPRARALLIGGVAALYLAASAFYATRWRDDETLLSHAVVACPDSVHDHARYAAVLDRDDQIDEAAWHFALAALGRQRFPARWRHPAIEAEERLPPDERLRRMGELLPLGMPVDVFRLRLMNAMKAEGLLREAAAVDRLR